MAIPATNSAALRSQPSSLAAQVAQQARSQPAGQQAATSQPASHSAATAPRSVLQMRSPQSSPAAVLAPGQLSTPELFARLQRSATALRNSLIEISYLGWQLRQRNDWQALGLADETAARETLGLGEATWQTYMTLGERLVASGLTLEQLRSLTVESARLLTRVHPRLWHEYAWLDEARMLSTRQLASLVDERNRLAAAGTSAGATPRGLAETSVKLSLSCSRMQHAALDSRLTTLRRALQHRSAAETLLHAVAAAERQPGIVEAAAKLQQQTEALAQLWPADAPWSATLAESAAEREVRYAGDPAAASLTAAAHDTAAAVAQLRASVEALHALLR